MHSGATAVFHCPMWTRMTRPPPVSGRRGCSPSMVILWHNSCTELLTLLRHTSPRHPPFPHLKSTHVNSAAINVVPRDRLRLGWLTVVSRGEKMAVRGTDPESYITEYVLVYEDKLVRGTRTALTCQYSAKAIAGRFVGATFQRRNCPLVRSSPLRTGKYAKAPISPATCHLAFRHTRWHGRLFREISTLASLAASQPVRHALAETFLPPPPKDH